MNYRMKMGFAVISLLSCFPAIAASLDGFAKNYNSDKAENNPQYLTAKKLPNQLVANGQLLRFESTTVSDVQRIFGGKIKSSSDESWVCYNAESEKRTYWFISYTEMQHGDLSTVVIAPLDKSASCDIPVKTINLLLLSMPALGEKIKDVHSFYGIKERDNATYLNIYNLFEDKAKKDEIDRLNIIEYYFSAGKVTGMLISQVTST